MDYVSPGGAFSSAFADSQLQRQQRARQAMLDDLTKQKTVEELAMGHDRLKEEHLRTELEYKDKDRTKFNTHIREDYGPGDFYSAEDIQKAKDLGVVLPVRESQVPLAGLQPPVPEPPSSIRLGGPPPVQTPMTKTVQTAAGSREQRDVLAQQEKAKAFIDALPDTDPRKNEMKQAFEAELAGLKVPPGYFSKQTTTDQEAVFRQNPRTGTVERLQNNVWTSWGGDVPKGAHFMTEPAPKDTSARDAAADRQLQTVHDRAITELDKWATPIEGHLDAIRSLGTMINAKTPEADKLVAPLVIKATIAGQGSGFRMTRAEIENVVGGRSHWETLQAALQQWSLDPTKALSLTGSQRDDLRSLTKKIREKATKLSRQITDARHTIDDATDVKAINRARTRLQEDLASMDEEDGTTGTTGTGKRIVYGMDGKPVKP